MDQREEVPLSSSLLGEEEAGHDQALCFELLALQVVLEAHLTQEKRRTCSTTKAEDLPRLEGLSALQRSHKAESSCLGAGPLGLEEAIGVEKARAPGRGKADCLKQHGAGRNLQ